MKVVVRSDVETGCEEGGDEESGFRNVERTEMEDCFKARTSVSLLVDTDWRTTFG